MPGKIHGPHICHICDRVLKKRIYLKKHLETHLSAQDKRHLCKFCSKKFSIRDYLNKHIALVHKKLKQQSCVFCERAFTRPPTLFRHIKSHIGEKDFWCEICGEEFTRTRLLKDHKIVHDKDKKLKCPTCSKGFNHYSSFDRHKALHRENKVTWECVICSKHLGNKSYLQAHIRIHLNEKPYSCSVCKEEFKFFIERKNHMQRDHGENQKLTRKRKSSKDKKSFKGGGSATPSEEVTQENLSAHGLEENPPGASDADCKRVNKKKSTIPTEESQSTSQSASQSESVREKSPPPEVRWCEICGEEFSGEKMEKKYAMHIVTEKHYIMDYNDYEWYYE
ncbi:unnamed protein product [Orchesella dallaii]|uniref:C2H2-type domain-containing protein n=1 Tax=Orchesella dallaii TaxID=48710 RepID=A0ABP1R2K3_9HEXA